MPIKVKGEIKPGSKVTILFDAARLPFERSVSPKGKSEWTISAFYQVAPGAEVGEIKLVREKSGAAKKAGDEVNILKGVLSVPAAGSEAILWFLNTGATGGLYFDSDFGKNYHFPITAPAEEPVQKSRAKKA